MKTMRFEKYWKNELNNTANYILKLYTTKVNNKNIFTLEKKIMSCLLHIRQYKEYYFCNKRNYPKIIEIVSYPIRDKKADSNNFGLRYDLFNGNKENVELKELCNFFIHVNINSYFIPAYDRIYGIFFTSDRKTNISLYYINLSVFAKILFSLAKNEEIGIEIKFAEEGKIKNIEFTNKW